MTPRLVLFLVLALACARTPVGPPTKSDTTCDQDSDCMAWPSGCCEWKAVSKHYRGPPGPGAGCEMECPRAPTGTACLERTCHLRWPDESLPEPKQPSR